MVARMQELVVSARKASATTRTLSTMGAVRRGGTRTHDQFVAVDSPFRANLTSISALL
jgi:hypothetical protein